MPTNLIASKEETEWEYVNPYFGKWADHDVESGGSQSNYAFRAQPIPYDWVPEGAPRSENAVIPPDVSEFKVPSK